MRWTPFAIAMALLMQFGCSSSDATNATRDAGAGTPPCFEHPTTHEEIINACTAADVEKIEKKPTLPLLGPNGERPPLP